MIGTDENRAVLHVEVVFWSGKRKFYGTTSASEARKRRLPKASPFTRMPPSGLAIKQEWSDWHDRDR